MKLEQLKNLNRYEILGLVVAAVILYYVTRLIIGIFQKSQRRTKAEQEDLIHVEAKYWPLEQREPKFLELCRRGTRCGAVVQHGNSPILVLANDEYFDWDRVPGEKQHLIGQASEIWTFDAHDHDSRTGASNRILQLDRKIQKLNHGGAPQAKRELTEELKRTVIFIGETYGAEMGRDVAKAALPIDRKHLVDVLFDAIVITTHQRKLRAEAQRADSSGLEIDFDGDKPPKST